MGSVVVYYFEMNGIEYLSCKVLSLLLVRCKVMRIIIMQFPIKAIFDRMNTDAMNCIG